MDLHLSSEALGLLVSYGHDPCHDVTHTRTQPLGMNHYRKSLILLQLGSLIDTHSLSWEKEERKEFFLINGEYVKKKRIIYRRIVAPTLYTRRPLNLVEL